ncbi:hypothetical protein [Escherichia fergusonii]|uniref:hypothetical protein n=1 Tax=Escherichia fergusonii TaxID=564 RepID=UPI003F6DB618
MNKNKALTIVNEKLLGEQSIPVRVRAKIPFSESEVTLLYEALDYLGDVYRHQDTVPKSLALALVDVYGLFSFREGMYSHEQLVALEDIGITLQEKAINLFS